MRVTNIRYSLQTPKYNAITKYNLVDVIDEEIEKFVSILLYIIVEFLCK